MFTHKSLLEAYVYAKDKCCPALIHDIYLPNAVLSISTSASAVAFPPLVVGAEGIAQTLVSDFATRFTQCRTYYVCDQLQVIDNRIAYLPWLVLMRENASASLRIGRGYYHWQLVPAATSTATAATTAVNKDTTTATADDWRISEMHIRIDHMMLIADVGGDLLPTLQALLPYPWLSPRTLDAAFGKSAQDCPTVAFLREFTSDKLVWPQALQAMPA